MRILNYILLVVAIGLMAWIGLSVAKIDLTNLFSGFGG